MAKIVNMGSVTVELSVQEVELIRAALNYSVRYNTEWDNPEDRKADEIERVLSGVND
ncbi:hypothetical protein ACFWM7_01440 [Streptomyces sp. NPDC058375]|uniref:hypothetical protein n=1 Tax=Streptomyces sp. NPDC058375 TaxID=3346467 RepID=UPI00364F410F